MKKMRLNLIIFCLLFFQGLLLSQNYPKIELSANIGFGSSNLLINGISNATVYVFTFGTHTYETIDATGAVHLSFKYHPSKRWMLGMSGGYEKVKVEEYIREDLVSIHDRQFINIGLEGGFKYISHDNFQLYSGLGLSYTMAEWIVTSKSNYVESEDMHGFVNFQVTGLGIRFGDQIGFTTEFGFGYKGIINLGLSFRFNS